MRRYKLQVGSTSQKSNPSDPHVTLSQEDLSRWPLSPPFFLFLFFLFSILPLTYEGSGPLFSASLFLEMVVRT